MPQNSTSETNAFDLGVFKRNYVLYLIAIFQGLALLAMYKAIDHQIWPYGNTIATNILLSVFIPIPLFALLTLTRDNWRAVSRYLVLSTIVFTAIAAYMGYQMGPTSLVRANAITFIYVLTIFLLSFKAVMYIQQRVDSENISYSALFKYSWRNTLSVILATIFTSTFWGILMLWAGLFKVLEIDWFYDLFTDEWFYIPVMVGTFGVAISIVRDLNQLLDNSSRIPQALIKFLLPMLIIVSVTFLVTIPFRGLDLLWKTGVGTALVLWLQALTLFFANSVFRDEPDVRPYPLFLHRMIYWGVALLPVYSAIAFYGLYLRVEQYGLTVSRCWAFVVWFFLACFAIGYLYGIIKKRDQWVAALGEINIRMGLVVLATMILVNSPVLDFRKISVASQFDRLEKGDVDIADFDLHYVKNELGRAGYSKVQMLKHEIEETDPRMFAALDDLYVKQETFGTELTQQSFSDQLIVWPEGVQVDSAIIESAFKNIPSSRGRTIDASNDYFLFVVDLNRDNKDDYILVAVYRDSGYQSAWLFNGFTSNHEWSYISINKDNSSLRYAVENNEVKPVEPEWMNLEVGGTVIHIKN